MGCYALLQGIFPTQGSNPGLLHYRQIHDRLSYREAHMLLFLLKMSFPLFFSYLTLLTRLTPTIL